MAQKLNEKTSSPSRNFSGHSIQVDALAPAPYRERADYPEEFFKKLKKSSPNTNWESQRINSDQEIVSGG